MEQVSSERTSHVLRELMVAKTTGSAQPVNDSFATIRSFQSTFKRLSRTPEMIRIMLQDEFDFTSYIDGNEVDASVLEKDWEGCVFAIADYTDPQLWLEKALDEVERGVVVVMLVPARTSTDWFHSHVLEGANEVRFIKGRLAIGGRPANGFPDAITVFTTPKAREEIKAVANRKVAIVKCSTSFTSDQVDIETE